MYTRIIKKPLVIYLLKLVDTDILDRYNKLTKILKNRKYLNFQLIKNKE